VGSGFSRTGARPEVCEHVAPQSSGLGLMLPYTPVHHLLMSSIGRRALVMTSGNRSDEPIAVTNEDARARLRDIADLFLIHDRDIRVRCEDSVVREIGSSPVVIRRSRGYAPLPIALPFECPSPILAVGGQLKNTFALGSVRRAFLSHHAGDLDEWLALDAFERDIDLYERTFHIAPTVIAHDLHPDYASTRIARRRTGVTHVGVQHHHAHVAACMAEHRVEGPVIGVAWDGAGWGPDGCVWGGEFLVGDRFDVQRIAHFRYVALPGGDRAAREPWRMALAHLQDAGVDDSDVFEDVSISARRTVAQMIERGVNAPMTSSVGRLFDAVAAICGAVKAMTFEGQAAMWLESLAEQSTDRERYPFTIAEPLDPAATMTVDTRPLIRALDTDRRRGVAPGIIARRFHRTLAEVVRDVALLIRARTGLNRVALSGGVFLNALLTAEVETQLVDRGFEVYRHHLLPPGDGGLSLGQLAVAAARIATKDI